MIYTLFKNARLLVACVCACMYMGSMGFSRCHWPIARRICESRVFLISSPPTYSFCPAARVPSTVSSRSPPHHRRCCRCSHLLLSCYSPPFSFPPPQPRPFLLLRPFPPPLAAMCCSLPQLLIQCGLPLLIQRADEGWHGDPVGDLGDLGDGGGVGGSSFPAPRTGAATLCSSSSECSSLRFRPTPAAVLRAAARPLSDSLEVSGAKHHGALA